MINRVVEVGRLTKDPQLAYTAGSNIPYVRFQVAVNRTFSSSDGEKTADFIPCIAWRKQAENLAKFMKKGALVGVEGRLQSGKYENNGQTVFTLDVVADSIQFLDSRGSSNTNTETHSGNSHFNGGNQSNYSDEQDNAFSHSRGPMEVSDDDLPF